MHTPHTSTIVYARHKARADAFRLLHVRGYGGIDWVRRFRLAGNGSSTLRLPNGAYAHGECSEAFARCPHVG
jgi:hypothetical protein